MVARHELQLRESHERHLFRDNYRRTAQRSRENGTLRELSARAVRGEPLAHLSYSASQR